MARRKEVPPSLVTDFQQNLQAISEIASYLGHAEAANRDDQKLWFQTLVKKLGDLSKLASETQAQLALDAAELKAVPVTEIAEALGLTPSAFYLRRKQARGGGESTP